jgi:hypothetical protein
MFGIAAVVMFAIALILHIAGGGHGHLDVTTFTLLGLLFLAVHLMWPWTPWRRP